jgi:RimJ/RimL family protein N-acetyltransferase
MRGDVRNQRSRRVAERAGFRLEAKLRCEDRAYDGNLRDTTIHVLLVEDFQRDTVSQGAFVS